MLSREVNWCRNIIRRRCLFFGSRIKINYSQRQTLPEVEDMKRIRNIGIMAHVDGGKTTTTERMLYFSGRIQHLGDVDDGDTVTDYMEQERNRGITITSAAVTFFWNKYKINLIDTPGHVDFTVEVERSLRVLDGAVTILDSSAGVEAQTLTVWRQADRYDIPRIVFLNKMDKHRANFHFSIKSISDKLKVNPIVLHIPIGDQKTFVGLVDLITLQKYVWDPRTCADGSQFSKTKISQKDADVWDKAQEARTKLIETLADLDDAFGENILNDVKYDDIPEVDLHRAIRRVTLARKGVPVLCGSSLRNIGVQPLLNAVTWYLPDPRFVKHDVLEHYNNDLCAMAFKIIHDKQRGPLTFLRLFSGSVKSGANIYNINRDFTEKTTRLCVAQAGDFKDVSSIGSGNIAVVTGLKQTVTGDTLVSNQKSAIAAKKSYLKSRRHHPDKKVNTGLESREEEDDGKFLPILASMDIPDPVFFRAIEPPSLSQQKQLDYALQCLQREDPSFTVSINDESGQTIIGGMGELHIEIIRDRICTEYGVEADLGPLMISYRETVLDSVQESMTFDKNIADRRHCVTMCMSIHPKPGAGCPTSVQIVHTKENELDTIKQHHLKAINIGMKSGMSQGPILGFPVTEVEIHLHNFTYSFGTSLAVISACATECLLKTLQKTTAVLLQPMMHVEVNTDEERLHTVLGDLSQRHSQVLDVQARQDSRTVLALTPLDELLGYSTTLRTITSGTATFSMQLANYERVSALQQKNITQKLTGSY